MKTEFLIFDIGSVIKIGSAFTLIGIVDTVENAKKLLKEKPITNASKVVVVEKKLVIQCRPAVDLQDLDEDLQL